MGTHERSFDEYLAARGWSSKLFLPHAMVAIPALQKEYTVVFRRTFVTVSKGGMMAQLRVHHAGRDRNWLSIVVGEREVSAHHHSEPPDAVLAAIRSALSPEHSKHKPSNP